VPFRETGERAAALLMLRMAGENVPRRELLPVHLVVRESTGPPRLHPLGTVRGGSQ
jgi:LacI family transcriptional regulator